MHPKDLFGIPSKDEEFNDYQAYGSKLIDFICENRIKLISDWERGGSDTRDAKRLLKGPILCRAISERILEKHPKFFVAEQEIVKVIVRIKDSQGQFMYLMTLKEQSRRLQFPGGRLRNNESSDVALRRELYEEVPECRFQIEKNCTIKPLFSKPIEEIIISPTYGVPIRFIIHYYFLYMNDDQQDICTRTSQWVSQEELVKGHTDNGILLMPPPRVFMRLVNALGKNVSSLKTRECSIPIKSKISENTRFNKSIYNPILIMFAFTILIGVTTASLIIAHNLAGSHFNTIMVAIILLVIVGITFSLRMANKISAKDTASLLGRIVKKS